MFYLEKLNYSFDSFDKLSSKSFEVHYGKHHAGYVNMLNMLLGQNEDLKNKKIEEIIKFCYQKLDDAYYKKLFNNASQHWNHSFFWKSITPFGAELQDGLLKYKIESKFGSLNNLFLEFEKVGLEVFGSGWVWIVWDKQEEEVRVLGTEKAYNPVQLDRYIPLLTCDVWEHAYYIDYLNNRKEFLSVIWNYFDWEFAQNNYQNI